MLTSMTGFARQAAEFVWGSAIWEIRSVNHRYLELSIRLPESLRMLEPTLRGLIQQQVKRGKIEVNLKLQLTEQTSSSLQFNQALIEQVLDAYQQFRQKVTNASFDFAKLLTWQGAATVAENDLSFVQADITHLFDQTIKQFNQMRQLEGQAIASLLAERLVAIAQQVQLANRYLPEALAQARSKLLMRFAELQQTLDPIRLEQEMVIVAQRLDVSEELDRLQQHLKQVESLLQQHAAVGRRLDFLMQELNREANTLGSKASDIRLTQVAVEIKVLIEQMREQIQNIE